MKRLPAPWLATIRAVAFDVDGTLYRNGAMYRRSISVLLRHPRLFAAFHSVRLRQRADPPENLAETTAEFVAQRLGVTREAAAARLEAVIYGEWERRLEEIPLVRGTRRLLLHLGNRGIRRLVLSDYPVGPKLRLIGLGDLIDFAISSETVGVLKPNRAPFDALSRAAGVPPEQILYIGNSEAYDIAGARGAGMRTARLRGRIPVRSKADLVLFDFDELISRFESV